MIFYFVIISIIIVAFSILIIIRFWLNQIEEKNKVIIDWLKTSTMTIDQRLASSMEQFNSRLDQVQKNIGQFSEIGRSMQELQQFLSSPKIRGNIGESILADLLKQHFPKNSYKLQYQFRSGEKVDAVILTANGLIPIDAKFPFDNYKKYAKAQNLKEKENFKKNFVVDVKKHIDKIAQKYILPSEKTVDYALMYIPSENLYYEIINIDEIFDYAGEKRVLPVSPMSFFAYIKAILLSLEGQKIEAKAKQIITLLQAIKKDYEKTAASLGVLNRHLTNAYHQANELASNFSHLGEKLNTTNLLEEKDN
jgi:DNA recombination protein RmuC